MKKALIALAVLGAVSGAAMAQSSVTLYGVGDIALGKARSGGAVGGAPDKKVGAQSNTVVTNGTSRIGLRGKEDLGGGLWAGFNYEGQVNLANGSTNSYNAVGNGAAWTRAAFVTLGSNAFGSVNLGRNLTPSYDGVMAWELTNEANYSVVNATYGFGGAPNNRNNAQLEYRTPNIYGFWGELSYIPKADGALVDKGVLADGVTGGTNKIDRWDLALAYQAQFAGNQQLGAALTVNKSRNDGFNLAVNNRNNTNKANWSLGAQYKYANLFAVAASYNRANSAQQWSNSRNNDAGYATVWGARRYGFSVGGSAFLGPFTVTLDLTRDTKNDLYYVNGQQKKYTNGLLAGQYSLSKRTFLYADYLRLDGENNYGLGIRHNF
jgi:predicted porin